MVAVNGASLARARLVPRHPNGWFCRETGEIIQSGDQPLRLRPLHSPWPGPNQRV